MAFKVDSLQGRLTNLFEGRCNYVIIPVYRSVHMVFMFNLLAILSLISAAVAVSMAETNTLIVLAAVFVNMGVTAHGIATILRQQR